MAFSWSLSDCKFPQVSGILLSILTDLNNAVVWMTSTCPFISKSSSFCTNHLMCLRSVPITAGITVIFMFHKGFSSLTRSRYLSLFSLFSVLTCSQPEWQSPLFGRFSFFLLNFTRSGRLAELRWSVCISQFRRSLWVSFSCADSGLCTYHSFFWSNLNFFC